MTHTEFCYWLKGYFELTQKALPDEKLGLTPEQAELIKDKLNSLLNQAVSIPGVVYNNEFIPPFISGS